MYPLMTYFMINILKKNTKLFIIALCSMHCMNFGINYDINCSSENKDQNNSQSSQKIKNNFYIDVYNIYRDIEKFEHHLDGIAKSIVDLIKKIDNTVNANNIHTKVKCSVDYVLYSSSKQKNSYAFFEEKIISCINIIIKNKFDDKYKPNIKTIYNNIDITAYKNINQSIKAILKKYTRLTEGKDNIYKVLGYMFNNLYKEVKNKSFVNEYEKYKMLISLLCSQDQYMKKITDTMNDLEKTLISIDDVVKKYLDMKEKFEKAQKHNKSASNNTVTKQQIDDTKKEIKTCIKSANSCYSKLASIENIKTYYASYMRLLSNVQNAKSIFDQAYNANEKKVRDMLMDVINESRNNNKAYQEAINIVNMKIQQNNAKPDNTKQDNANKEKTVKIVEKKDDNINDILELNPITAHEN